MAVEQSGQCGEAGGDLGLFKTGKPQLPQDIAEQQGGIGLAREEFGCGCEEIGADPFGQPRLGMDAAEQPWRPAIGINRNDAVKAAQKGIGQAPTGTGANKNEAAGGRLPAGKERGQRIPKRLPQHAAADKSPSMPPQTTASVTGAAAQWAPFFLSAAAGGGGGDPSSG